MAHLRKSATIICLIALGSVASLLPSVASAQPVDAEWVAYCDTYTTEAVAQSQKAEEWQCSRFEGYWDPPRWSTEREVHLPWCLRQDPDASPGESQPQLEDTARLAGLFECQNMIAAEATTAAGEIEDPGAAGDILTEVVPADPAPAPAPGGEGLEMTAAKVNGDVELFDEPGGDGTVIGELEFDTEVQAGCREDQWCFVGQMVGMALVPRGWVWGEFLDF